MDGKEELICCSVDGEVRGYLPASQESLHGGVAGVDVGTEAKRLEELNQKKQVRLREGIVHVHAFVCIVVGRGLKDDLMYACIYRSVPQIHPPRA